MTMEYGTWVRVICPSLVGFLGLPQRVRDSIPPKKSSQFHYFLGYTCYHLGKQIQGHSTDNFAIAAQTIDNPFPANSLKTFHSLASVDSCSLGKGIKQSVLCV